MNRCRDTIRKVDGGGSGVRADFDRPPLDTAARLSPGDTRDRDSRKGEHQGDQNSSHRVLRLLDEPLNADSRDGSRFWPVPRQYCARPKVIDVGVAGRHSTRRCEPSSGRVLRSDRLGQRPQHVTGDTEGRPKRGARSGLSHERQDRTRNIVRRVRLATHRCGPLDQPGSGEFSRDLVPCRFIAEHSRRRA